MSRRVLAPGVLVADPGGISWMAQAAATFAGHGELAEYCSPAAIGAAQLRALEQRLPPALARPVGAQLRLRVVPEIVPADRVLRAATAMEIAYVMARRRGWSERVVLALTRLETEAFDRAVARRVRPNMTAVVGYQSNAVATFAAAERHDVTRVLDYPIAHYQTLEAVLAEEARLVPAYAGTLQDAYPSWTRQRYAREIADADAIVMLSSYQRETFVAAGIDPAKLFIAPLGVDLDLFTPAPEPSPGTFRVIFCGQITQRKGISYLVEGFRRAELGDAELIFIGMPVGAPHPWMNTAQIRHVGPLARHQLPAVMRTGHVTVLPSLIEGFGATVLEGMACGLPAIVSEHTLGRDVIDDGVDGWVLPIRDPDAIAERLRRLYEDRLLQTRMAIAARAKAEQFPWSRYGEALRSGIAERRQALGAGAAL